MKKNLAAVLTVLLAGAAVMVAQQAFAQATQANTAPSLPLAGTTSGEVPPAARLGVWLVGPTGAPLEEVRSVPAGSGAFRLELGADVPPARALRALTAEGIAWPGVTGTVNVQGSALIAEARIFLYGDRNDSGRRETTESLLETTAQQGRSAVLLLYVDRPVTVTAARGFEARLTPGWNVLSVDLGRTLKVTVRPGAEGLTVTAVR